MSNQAKEERSFLNEFHEWNAVTGALEPDTGWFYECVSIFVDADKQVTRLHEQLEIAERNWNYWKDRCQVAETESGALSEIKRLRSFRDAVLAGCTDEIYNGEHPHVLWQRIQCGQTPVPENAHKLDPSREDQRALIKWAYELTEKALWLKGHAARVALIKASADINNRFKQYAR